MPNRPEDDWTRPIPRSPRGDRARPRDPEPYDSWTGSSQDAWDPQAHDDWADQTRELPTGRRATAADYGYSDDEFADERWEEVEYAEAPRGRTGRRADYEGGGYDAGDYDGGGRHGGRPGPPRGGAPRRPTRRRFRLRRVMAFLLLIVLAYVASMIWAVASIWSSIDRVDSTPTNAARPGAGSGSNFLLVGTDSREDLTRDERNDLVTGHTEGARADTIMLLHLPDGGDPVLLSIPRDSYVEIPGQGSNKINAAYSIGGPKMLVDTVEQSTGLRIDGYLEIGFGGFVEVVGTVGGVRMCLDEPVTDEKTRLDLPAGCQELAGKEALNYVRMRYGDPRGDLGRVERQREFLAALTHEMAKPATVLVPWRLHQVGTATGSAIALGEDTSMWEAGRIALGMRSISDGNGQSLTVPVANTNYQTAAGSSVLWDEVAAADLFTALRTGAPLSIEP
ncbi:LCP family protein [Ornithinimicrobium cryptoxanthini]|uniref:LCP family protein n=1 Tax=Ornithinimicrobium cryptoxanthini TaxID=2934161 RepID=A0ABY4YGC4_9MICO|nr:LCP family protein [Ornithinimicrobium cryptoxanthini]USQ75305.1 LCP family protein [Ornithinimicrobium cryptoxanthini]